jgi:GWxTD domain-containing protein
MPDQLRVCDLISPSFRHHWIAVCLLVAGLSVDDVRGRQVDRPAACLDLEDTERCLKQFDRDAEGLGDAWRSFGLGLLAEQNVRDAGPALDEASRWHPDLRGLAMWARQHGNPTLLQPARAARNRVRATSILRADSLDAGANLLIGTQDAREVARRSRRASVPDGFSADQAVTHLRTGGPGIGPGVRMNHRSQDVDMVVSSAPREGRLMRQTVRRLRVALRSPVTGPFALRQLGVVHLGSGNYEALSGEAAQLRTILPSHADGYLIGALAAHQEGRLQAAATLAELGLDLLPAERRALVMDPTGILPPGYPVPEDLTQWWLEQDPVVLTAINERFTEHVARWVYADLRFGNPYSGAPGVETDPGRVILRYGVPSNEIQFTGGDKAGGEAAGWDRYAVFQYPAFDFRFMDMARSGSWSFYAPRSRSFEGGARVNSEVRSADYVILSRERFRDTPTFIEPTWETAEMQMAIFRDAGAYVVVGTGVVPEDLRGADNGAMVLDESNRIVSLGPSDVPHWTPGAPFVAPMRIPIGRSQTYQMRVEAVAPSTLTSPARTLVLSSAPQPAPGGSGLVVSGVLLADLIEDSDGEDHPGVWRRSGLVITPSGDNQFEVDAPLYAYFEGYGLTQRASGSTEYDIVATLSPINDGRSRLGRLFGRRGGSVGVEFRGTGESPSINEYLLIDTQDRRTGDYLLTLTINDLVARTSVETSVRVHFR